MSASRFAYSGCVTMPAASSGVTQRTSSASSEAVASPPVYLQVNARLTMGGIFIPAHVDRPTFSLSSQLGFVPTGLKFHALELSYYCKRNGYKFLDDCPWFSDFNFIQSSDAHFIEDIAKIHSELEMPFFSFDNFKDALRAGEPVIL